MAEPKIFLRPVLPLPLAKFFFSCWVSMQFFRENYKFTAFSVSYDFAADLLFRKIEQKSIRQWAKRKMFKNKHNKQQQQK